MVAKVGGVRRAGAAMSALGSCKARAGSFGSAM